MEIEKILNKMEIEKIKSLKELTVEEAENTYGGESAWYWVFYAIGSAVYINNRLRSNPNHGNAAVYK